MAHRNMVAGTAYDTSGGRVLADGTVYSIQKGKTMVDGTNRSISFVRRTIITIVGTGSGDSRYVQFNSSTTRRYTPGTHEFEDMEKLTATVKDNGGAIYHNGDKVAQQGIGSTFGGSKDAVYTLTEPTGAITVDFTTAKTIYITTE